MDIVKKHPVAITFYILYTMLCIRLLIITKQFHQRIIDNPGRGGICFGGEEVALAIVFLFGAIFFFINLIYACVKINETYFYLWLMLVIVVQPIVFFNLSS